MLKWILEHIGIVVVLVVFASQIFRSLMQTRRTRDQPPGAPRDAMGEDRRVREVQEQIRRQIAARRAGRDLHAPPPLEPAVEAPIPRAETTQLPELFGGPLGRMLEELQRKAQQHAPTLAQPPPLPVETHHAGELERQQRLADELRAAEDARQVTARRAAHLAADQLAAAQSEPVLRSAAHARLMLDLRDPQGLRRAFVLREVLGPPLGLK